MAPGQTVVLTDARDNRNYRVRKMPDGQCWMIDNLAYTGGGTNTFGDAIPRFSDGTPTTSSTGVLIEHTGGGDWPVGGSNANRQTVRQFANNSSAGFNNTACLPGTATGSGFMQSTCGNQVLYNFCAAAGLDSSTTPTCAEVSNTLNTGLNMAATGIVGRPGGTGGESRGNASVANQDGVNSATNGTICPGGWRLPVGRVGSADNTRNEWNTLHLANGSGLGFWQPAGTAGALPGAFGTVSAGNIGTSGNLLNQSTNADWWTSSLFSDTFASSTFVSSASVGPGTLNSINKARGLTVRFVFP